MFGRPYHSVQCSLPMCHLDMATTSTTIPPLDTSAEGPPEPGHVTFTYTTLLPATSSPPLPPFHLSIPARWPRPCHLHLYPPPARARRVHLDTATTSTTRPRHVTSPPVSPFRSSTEGPP